MFSPNQAKPPIILHPAKHPSTLPQLAAVSSHDQLLLYHTKMLTASLLKPNDKNLGIYSNNYAHRLHCHDINIGGRIPAQNKRLMLR
jgi:hypothetical protein